MNHALASISGPHSMGAGAAVFLVALAVLTTGSLGPCTTACADTTAEGNRSVFRIAKSPKRTSITFHSKAPLEDFSGTTSQVSGNIQFDPGHPEAGGLCEIRIPVASLNTGIPLRDEHLRSEDWLNAEQFPEVILTLTSVDSITVVEANSKSSTFEVIASGVLALHGAEQPITLTATMTHLVETETTRKEIPGDWLAVRAEFKIALAEFGIQGPARTDIVGTRVADSVTIGVRLLATSDHTEPARTPAGN